MRPPLKNVFIFSTISGGNFTSLFNDGLSIEPILQSLPLNPTAFFV
jgi:hypothetical protein